MTCALYLELFNFLLLLIIIFKLLLLLLLFIIITTNLLLLLIILYYSLIVLYSMILLYSVFTLAPHICSDGPANYQFRFRTVAIDLDWHYTKLGPNLGHRVEYTVPCVRAIISGCCRLVVLSAKPQYTFAPSAMKCQDLSKYWKLRSPS